MIAYSGTPIVYQEIDNSTQALTMSGLRDALVLAGWTLTSSVGGYTLSSAVTPNRLSTQVKITAEAGTLTGVQFISIDGVITLQKMYLTSAAARRLRVLANSYQFFTLLTNGWTTSGVAVMGGVPFIHPHQAPVNVASIVAGTPLRINTVTAHNLTEGASAYLGGLLGTGLSGVNTNWTVHVVNSTAITLVSSSYNSAALTAGTGVVAAPGKIGQLLWCMGDSSDGTQARVSFRQAAYPDAAATVYQSVVLNQVNWSIGNNNRLGRVGIIFPPYGYRWFNNQFINNDPYLVFGAATADSLPTVNAQIWDAAVVNYGFTGDLTTAYDGHNWVDYTGPAPGITENGSLFLAVS